MNKEKKIIKIINKIFPRSKNQLNKVFESDSEIIKFNDKKILFTTDKFSEEDFFRENDPYILGHNIAVGSITDILAAGGKPLYLLGSLTVSKNWSDDFIKKFIKGMKDVLVKADVSFIGGDLSISNNWDCVTTVFGECTGKILLRSNAENEDSIYITGKIGTGNFEAGLKLFKEIKPAKSIKNKFNLRIKEFELIKKHSGCCIDTSDGVFNAIKTICENSKKGCDINNLNFIDNIIVFLKYFNMPPLLLFLGECGEYELLFTISKKSEKTFLEEAKMNKIIFYKLGKINNDKKIILNYENKIINLSDYNINARDYTDKKKYLKKIIEYLASRNKI